MTLIGRILADKTKQISENQLNPLNPRSIKKDKVYYSKIPKSFLTIT